jgi:coniferyl-aldehyde dehydrogenase
MIVQLVAGPALLMQREIFGPILPLRGYTSLDAVIKSVNARPRLLAIYRFSNDRGQVQMLLDCIMSGGVSVNDAWWHVGQNDLPFGGVGESVQIKVGQCSCRPLPRGEIQACK